MATKKSTSKIYVTIAEQGTMFRDHEQGVKILGGKPVEVEATDIILKAIKDGLIKEVDAPAKQEAPSKKAVKGAGKAKPVTDSSKEGEEEEEEEEDLDFGGEGDNDPDALK